MLQKTQCVVLSHVKYGDSGLIVKVLTKDFGRQSLMVHGVRKKRPKFNPYFFEPFSLLDIELYYKLNQDLHILKEAKSSIVLQQLYFDIRKSTIAIFLSEIISKSLQEIESNPALFNFLYHAVQILDVSDEGVENFHLIFLLELSKFMGIHPENNHDLHLYPINGEVQIPDLLNYSLTDITRLKLSAQNKAEILSMLVNYYRHHLEGMGEIKSLAVLRTVFNN
ncbi:MAG: DNA repair protein RecO [Bacteroidales bacterium]|nr:DNA repair protein RecO [Bacteroidales bacterium]